MLPPLEAIDIDALDIDALRRKFPELRLLILHGSRARGDAHPGSDWDFAYLADPCLEGPGLDELGLRAALSSALQTDDIDVADLNRAGAVLRYAAARDAKPVLEREPGTLESFRFNAIRFWLENEPILRQSQRAVLKALG
jgi:predicted nucleotidyltransferase